MGNNLTKKVNAVIAADADIKTFYSDWWIITEKRKTIADKYEKLYKKYQNESDGGKNRSLEIS